MAYIDMPEKPIKHRHAIEIPTLNELEHVLEFVQSKQQDVTRDLLLKEMLLAYTRRRKTDFPVQYDTQTLQFVVSTRLDARLHKKLEERQLEEPGATMTDLVRHAIEHFLSSNKRIMQDYRTWALEQGDASPASKEPESGHFVESKDEVVSSMGQAHISTLNADKKSEILENIRQKRLAPKVAEGQSTASGEGTSHTTPSPASEA